MRVSLLIIFGVIAALLSLSGCASWTAEKRSPAIGRFIEAEGARLHVLDMGPKDSAAAPLVLIHGASVNLRDMKLALGDRLAQSRRVILIDRPGRGYSSRPENAYRLEVQARMIKAAVDELGVQKPIVVGQSFGGAVALRYALEYQDEMSGLVLLAAVSHEWPGGLSWYTAASQWPVACVFLRRLIIPFYGQLAAKDGVARNFAPNTPPPHYYEDAGLGLLFRAQDFKSNAEDIAHLKAEIIAQQGRYGELKLPVEIVTGLADNTVSPELHSKRLAKEIDGARLTLLPNTGHALHHAEADKIIDLILNLEEPRS